MKLTKDDFHEWDERNIPNELIIDSNNPKELADQILKNQADAEEWNEYKGIFDNMQQFVSWLDERVKENKIVERLKKRIEECWEWRKQYKKKPNPTDDDRDLLYLHNDIIFELQKILGEKNG